MLEQFFFTLKLPLAQETGKLVPVSVGGVKIRIRWEARVYHSHARREGGRKGGREGGREGITGSQWFNSLNASYFPNSTYSTHFTVQRQLLPHITVYACHILH